MASYDDALVGLYVGCLKKFCTCRPRLSGYDNSPACVVMWFKLRRLGVYKVKKMGMNLKNQGSDGKCYNMRYYWHYSTTIED